MGKEKRGRKQEKKGAQEVLPVSQRAARVDNIEDGSVEERPVQWHEGFMCALELEFKDNWDHMEFVRNYSLNTRPLEIDMLIIEKDKGVEIENDIGEFFRTFNIIEYKSDRDKLNFDTVLKAEAYACLYKCDEGHFEERPYDEVTVTLIRRLRPRGLFKYLKEHGFRIEETHRGIYRIEGKLPFPTQIIVGKELDKERHKLLDITSDNVSKQEILDAFVYRSTVTDKREQDLLDSVLDLCMRLNEKSIVEMQKEDEKMHQALRAMFEPEIREVEREANQRLAAETQRVEREANQRLAAETQRVEKETAQRVERETMAAGIKLLVKNMRRFNAGDDDIRSTLMEDYGLSEAEAMSYLS